MYTQYCIIQINTVIQELVNELKLPMQDLYNDNINLIEKILQTNSMSEIEWLFKDIIDRIALLVQQSKDSKVEKHIKKIQDYIAQNYMNQFALEDICSSVDLSPTYVWQILKHKTHKSFIQYLNEYRIEKACELLGYHGDEAKIKDIASKVGFSSSKYFIQVFKELKGVTPGEYR